MLQIVTPNTEQWDEANNEFVYTKSQKLQLEHSLVSISKWESKWCKPFISNTGKTSTETLDYIKCMTLTQNVQPEIYGCLTMDNIKDINNYIESDMTATTFRAMGNESTSREVITSELIYYWMIALDIPFECQKWHLNRLLTLIRICNIKNKAPKKQNAKQIMSRNAALNQARRDKLNTKG